MWLIILAICILVTILEMFSKTQFFTKTEGYRIFFLWPVARLTNWGHVRDFRASTPLLCHRLTYSHIWLADVTDVTVWLVLGPTSRYVFAAVNVFKLDGSASRLSNTHFHDKFHRNSSFTSRGRRYRTAAFRRLIVKTRRTNSSQVFNEWLTLSPHTFTLHQLRRLILSLFHHI